MKQGFMAGGAMFFLLGGIAMAQTTTYSQTTKETAPVVNAPAPDVAPPPGTLSTTQTTKSTDAYGNSYESSKTTYGNPDGAASDSVTTTTTAPAGTYYTEKRSVTTTTTGSGD